MKIDSIASQILASDNPKNVGLYRINVPTRSLIKTVDLQVGNTVEVEGRLFEIVEVELSFQLLNPPIPILILKCKGLPCSKGAADPCKVRV